MSTNNKNIHHPLNALMFPVFNDIHLIMEEMEQKFIQNVEKQTSKYPFTNIWIEPENKKAVIEILVGGFKASNVLKGISIDENEHTIKVEVEREQEENNENRKYILKNIACRPFRVKYNIPFKNVEKINANVKDGKLTIEIFEKEIENKIKLNLIESEEK